MKYILLSSILLSCAALAQEPDSSSALFSMREAERNFAKESLMYGRNAAFGRNFAEQSVMFTGKWITNGKQYSLERSMVPVVLKWEPEYMDISASRDFGISTGPWEVQEYRPGTTPLATGYFLTVWKREASGTWKVILDGGSTTPPLKNPKHSFQFIEGADKPVNNPPVLNSAQLSSELLEVEKQALALHLTYKSILSKDARIQLNGHLPSVNSDTINTWISHFDKKLIWNTSGSGAASSGDMGYTYGMLEVQGDSKPVKGHYVNIWKKKPDGSWKIIIQMINFD